MTEREFAEQYYGQRGICLKMVCTVNDSAKRLGIEGIPDGFLVSAKLVWAGAAAGSSSEPLFPENDDCTYRYMVSPFEEEPRSHIAWGMCRDASNNLWFGPACQTYIRNPKLYDSGLKIIIDIPNEIINKEGHTEFVVLINDEETLHEKITDGGTKEWIISFDGLGKDMLSYLMDSKRQHMILLEEIKRVCKKHDLKYYLICGGLIGIKRTGSLIPWDDDIDIAMTRDDYDRLLTVADEEWPAGGDFCLIAPGGYGEDIFLDCMTRLVYMKEEIKGDAFARLGSYGRQDIHYHMPADIYVLDKTSDGRIGHFLQTEKILFIYALAMGHRNFYQPSNRVNNSRLKLQVAKLIGKIGKRISLKRLLGWHEKTATGFRRKKCRDYFQSNGYYKCVPMRFPINWFGQGEAYDIDGTVIRIPEQSEAFLQQMYGDYRKYPYFPFRQPSHLHNGEKEQL